MQTNRVMVNTIWIVACRIIQSILAIFISMLTARYLGPSNYGIINYAASIVAFVVPIMQLGFKNTLVQEFVKNPEKEGETLATALILNLCSAFICIIGVISFVMIVNKGETETIIVCSLYSLNLIFQALEMSQYWYQAKLLSKYTSIVSLFAYIVISVYKIVLLVTNMNLYWFAISQALDYLIIAVSLLIIYIRISKQQLKFSWVTGRKMLGVSKYYIISGLMVTVFGHIGSVFLKLLIDDSAVGYYMAAFSCAGMANFFFAAVVDSVRPSILEKKYNCDKSVFEKSMIELYAVIIYVSLIQGIIFSLLAQLIVGILYGGAYEASITPLRIMAWYALFSNLGMVRNVWILAEEKQGYLWIINLIGAVSNILLNIILILLWNVQGAAVASVLTQFIANVIAGYIIRPVRRSNYLMIAALNPIHIVNVIRSRKRI